MERSGKGCTSSQRYPTKRGMRLRLTAGGTVVLHGRLDATLDWDRALGIVDGFVLAVADIC